MLPICDDGAESLCLGEPGKLVDLAFDSFEGDRHLLDCRPQGQLASGCLKAQGLLAPSLTGFQSRWPARCFPLWTKLR